MKLFYHNNYDYPYATNRPRKGAAQLKRVVPELLDHPVEA